MTGTLTVPTIGVANATEDVDIRDSLNTLNGLLTPANALDGATLGAGTVAAAGLASNSVTTAKITDANVTDAKLASPNNSVYKTVERNQTWVAYDQAAGTWLFTPDTYACDSTIDMGPNLGSAFGVAVRPIIIST